MREKGYKSIYNKDCGKLEYNYTELSKNYPRSFAHSLELCRIQK